MCSRAQHANALKAMAEDFDVALNDRKTAIVMCFQRVAGVPGSAVGAGRFYSLAEGGEARAATTRVGAL